MLWKTGNNARSITQASPDVTHRIWRAHMHDKDIFRTFSPKTPQLLKEIFLSGYNTLPFTGVH